MGVSDKSKPGKTKPLAGGVRHDERGNAVWQWAADTARHAAASTSQLLRRLEISNLKLQEPDDNKPPSREAGFNPYDGVEVTSAATTKRQPDKRQADKQQAIRQQPAARKKPSAVPVRVRTPWWRALFGRH